MAYTMQWNIILANISQPKFFVGVKYVSGLEKSVYLSDLDFYKAFDKVPHQRLIKTKNRIWENML